jgi:hypothetical protein
MKIKVYLPNGYKIINVEVWDSIKRIANSGALLVVIVIMI